MKNSNYEFNTLQRIALNTRNKIETLSETICLYRRDLLDSCNYSVICVPIYSDVTIKNVIQNINLISYLKEKYKSKIIVCLNKRNKYSKIYDMFSDIYDGTYDCPRYYDISNCIEELRVTKIIYNDSIDLIDDFRAYDVNISVDMKVYRENFDPNQADDFFCVSRSKDSNVKIPKSDRFLEISQEITQENIRYIINSKGYINVSNNSDIDCIVPFFGGKIFTYKTKMYENNLFKNSLSVAVDFVENINLKKLIELGEK